MDDTIQGYNLDKELSGQRAQVYHNPKTNHVIINHRGTKGINDMYTDMKLMFGFKNNKRFNHGKDITDEALKKYHNADVSITGHSLGHAIAKEANKEHKKELVTLNGAVTPFDIFDKPQENEHFIRTKYDPVSVLHNFVPMQDDENTTTINSHSLNLLDEHGTDTLDRLDDDTVFGK
jgi:hypothetical protein